MGLAGPRRLARAGVGLAKLACTGRATMARLLPVFDAFGVAGTAASLLRRHANGPPVLVTEMFPWVPSTPGPPTTTASRPAPPHGKPAGQPARCCLDGPSASGTRADASGAHARCCATKTLTASPACCRSDTGVWPRRRGPTCEVRHRSWRPTSWPVPTPGWTCSCAVTPTS